jgi:hypothetical protein
MGGMGRAPEPMPGHHILVVARLRNSLRRGEFRRKDHGDFVAKRAAVRGEVVAERRSSYRLGARLEIRAVALFGVRDAIDRSDGVGVDGLRLLHGERRPAGFDRAHAASLNSPRATR